MPAGTHGPRTVIHDTQRFEAREDCIVHKARGAYKDLMEPRRLQKRMCADAEDAGTMFRTMNAVDEGRSGWNEALDLFVQSKLSFQ